MHHTLSQLWVLDMFVCGGAFLFGYRRAFGWTLLMLLILAVPIAVTTP